MYLDRWRRFGIGSTVMDRARGKGRQIWWNGVAMHEFERENGLGGKEHKEPEATAWRTRAVNGMVSGALAGVWDFVGSAD